MFVTTNFVEFGSSGVVLSTLISLIVNILLSLRLIPSSKPNTPPIPMLLKLANSFELELFTSGVLSFALNLMSSFGFVILTEFKPSVTWELSTLESVLTNFPKALPTAKVS